jgi:membrane associated rhomboid family serine protease
LNPPRERLLNVPSVVVLTIAAMVLVHIVRTWILSIEDDDVFLRLFAFSPQRYEPQAQWAVPWLGGEPAQVWTFFTYSLIHGDWTHLALNTVWLLAFGSAVARRFGALRYFALFVITAAAGAGAHLLAHPGDLWPVVGASAAISGYMAAAIRFIFQAGGPLGFMGSGDDAAYCRPAEPLLVCLRDPRVLLFLAVWFGLNIFMGLTNFPLTGEGQSIAWQAHIGGFVAGLLLFPLFDPVRRATGAYGDTL